MIKVGEKYPIEMLVALFNDPPDAELERIVRDNPGDSFRVRTVIENTGRGYPSRSAIVDFENHSPRSARLEIKGLE